MKGNKGIVGLFFLCLFLSVSCTDTPKTLKAYKKWFYNAENQFIQEKKIGMLTLNAIYTPTAYLVAKELDDGKQYTADEIEKIRHDYEGGKNFILQIVVDMEQDVEGDALLKKQVRSLDEWRTLIEKLSFHMKDNLRLIEGKDTIVPSMYHFERGYELGQVQRFIVSFPSDKEDEDMILMFDDEHFDTGRNYFDFSDIKDIPTLPIDIKNDEADKKI